ncbi:MAG TPA: hypothetical protein VES38_11865 [Methylotenera sp.]|nr:hypothetical protein [Methylotenera sp.]
MSKLFMKFKKFTFFEIFMYCLIVIPSIFFALSSAETTLKALSHQIYGFPPLEKFERIEGNLVSLDICFSSRVGSGSIAKVITNHVVAELRTACLINKYVDIFHLKNEKIVAYVDKSDLFSISAPNVVELYVNGVEVKNYAQLIKHRRDQYLLIVFMGVFSFLFSIFFAWFGAKYVIKSCLSK